MTEFAACTPPSALTGALDPVRALAERLLREAPVSGGVIAVDVSGARLELTFGTRGPGGEPVAAEDRFEIGSISKTVAALAAARLAVTGRVDLDAPVRDALPWLPLPRGAGEPTLRHLLAHTAGWIAGNSASPGEVSQALALASSRAVSAPGASFHYSNVGYVVAGLALARLAGVSFPALVHDQVLAPLGLPGAVPSITGVERVSLVPGTVPIRDDADWRPGDPLASQPWVEPAGADGNVAASALELLSFGRALTAPSSVAAEADWLPAAVGAIATPTAPTGEDVLALGPHLPVRSARYGLGVNVEETEHGTLLTHGGGMIGYGAFLMSHAAADLTVAVTLSGPGEHPYAELLARFAHAVLLGAGDRGGVPSAAGVQLATGVANPLAALHPPRPALLVGTGKRAALTGHYRSYTPWCPHYEVGVDASDALVLRAYAGVEAPTTDTPLVRLADGGDESADGLWYRVGEDPLLPERAHFGDIVDGVAQTLDIDGCRYARVVDR